MSIGVIGAKISCRLNEDIYGQVQEILVLFAWVSSESSGVSEHMRRLTRAFTARIHIVDIVQLKMNAQIRI